jgi:hypothetical protein
MSDKLRAAAQAALLALDSDDPTINLRRAAMNLRAALAEPKAEYICKCGLRVTPHYCKTGKEF